MCGTNLQAALVGAGRKLSIYAGASALVPPVVGPGAWLVPLVDLLRLPVGILQICVHRPLEAVPVSSVNRLSILPNI